VLALWKSQPSRLFVLSSRSEGQREGHAGPAAVAVLGPDCAAVGLDEASRDRQAEAGAAARTGSRLVRAPQAREHPLGRPWRARAGVDPGELEEVVDKPGEDLGLRPDRLEVLARLGEIVLQRLDHRLQRGERRAQVVARPGDKLATGVEELLDARCHLVERGAELAKLSRPRLRRAGTQIAGGETRRGG